MSALSQMDNFVPPKWIKHKILTIWNLRDENDLKSTIHRYSINEYEKCLVGTSYILLNWYTETLFINFRIS